MIYVMVNRGTGFWQLAISFVVIGGAAYFGMGLMPGSEKVQERFGTLGNMQQDGSYQGRIEIYQSSVGSVLSNPIGAGLGATGLGRINSGRAPVIGDAGDWEVVTQLDGSEPRDCLRAVAYVAGDGEAISSGIQAL